MSDTKEVSAGLNLPFSHHPSKGTITPAPITPSSGLAEAVKTITKADIANHVGDLMDKWNGDDKL